MPWIKAFHLISLVTWFSGLFYLPRLFVYHAMATDEISIERFKVMERKLYFGITTPGAILTLTFGIWLLSFKASVYLQQGWMDIKLGLVALLLWYHVYLGKLVFTFKYDQNRRSHVFYRWLNEVPVIFLVSIILLVKVKP